VSFFYGAPEKTNAFVFSSGAIKKAAPCCFAFLDLKPPPRGTPSASGAKVIPQGNPLICGYRGTPSATGAKVIPRGKPLICGYRGTPSASGAKVIPQGRW